MTEEHITTGKAGAQDVRDDIETFFEAALPYYSGLTAQQRSDFLNTITTQSGWNTATAAEKADALRALLSLIIVAIYFMYLRFIGKE